MRAGNLNKRARFDGPTTVSDGAGGTTETWAEAMTVWAQLSPERGRERIQAGRIETELGAVLRIRSSEEARLITTKHRVTVDGQLYNITAISNPDQRNSMIEMTLQSVLD